MKFQNITKQDEIFFIDGFIILPFQNKFETYSIVYLLTGVRWDPILIFEEAPIRKWELIIENVP